MNLPYMFNPLSISQPQEESLEYFLIHNTTNSQGYWQIANYYDFGSSNPYPDIYYRMNNTGDWIPYTLGDEININGGETCALWNKNEYLSDENRRYHFVTNLEYWECSGDLMALANFSKVAKYQMFNSFFEGNSLTSCAKLTATTLQPQCYDYMFFSCYNLQSIQVSFTDWGNQQSTNSWVMGVYPEGTFYKPKSLAEVWGTDGIPSLWNIVDRG